MYVMIMIVRNLRMTLVSAIVGRHGRMAIREVITEHGRTIPTARSQQIGRFSVGRPFVTVGTARLIQPS